MLHTGDQRAWRIRFALYAAFGVCSVRCTAIEAPTRVEVSLSAAAELRARVAQVDFELYGETEQEPDEWPLRASQRVTPGGAWPLHWTFARGDRRSLRFAVAAVATDAQGVRIAQVRQIGTFRAGKTLAFELMFDDSCATPCAGATTCVRGECVVPEPRVDGHDGAHDGDATDAGTHISVAPNSPKKPQPESGVCAGGSGCDNAQQCSSLDASACGECPNGLVADPPNGCGAALLGLTMTGAQLEPAFSATHVDYTVTVGLIADRWTFTPSASPAVELSLDGERIESGAECKPKALIPGRDSLVLSATARGYASRSYRFKLQRKPEQVDFIKANPPSAGAHFGRVLALDGQTPQTLAVAAPDESSDAIGVDPPAAPNTRAKESGAVFLFVQDGGQWRQQAYLKPSDTTTGQQFGTSLALAGARLAVGSMNAQDGGAVYLFERQGSAWHEITRLAHPEHQTRAHFGQSVSLLGERLYVGAGAVDSGGASEAGAVYIYEHNATTNAWSLLKRLQPSVPVGYGWFGTSVRANANYVVAGATGVMSGSSVASGVAYVFDANSFQQRQLVMPSTALTTGFFGQLNEISGDTLVVTAFNGNAGLTSGAVYVYDLTVGSGFPQQAVLQASNASAGDYFGIGVAFQGDYLVVGASQEGSDAKGINGMPGGTSLPKSGAAYVFTRVAGSFGQTAQLKSSDPVRDELFGSGVAMSGDIIVVGAEADGHGSADLTRAARTLPESGAAYVFR